MFYQTATPPFRTPSPSTLPGTPPTQDEAETMGPTPPTNSSSTPGTMQALQAAMAASSNARAINTPGMAVSPLMADFSPSPAQIGTLHDAVQTFSPGTPLLDKTNSADLPLERLKRKVYLFSLDQ